MQSLPMSAKFKTVYEALLAEEQHRQHRQQLRRAFLAAAPATYTLR
jgi:hypothetical protein